MENGQQGMGSVERGRENEDWGTRNINGERINGNGNALR